MPGAYLYAWDSDLGAFRKVVVDSEGRFRTVAELDKLDNVGDVNVPTPTDDDLLYWDADAGKWQSVAHLGLPNAHHNQAHNLASHSTKAHTELTDVTADQHHDEFTGMEHSLLGNAFPHHYKYTDTEAVLAVRTAGVALAQGKNIEFAPYLDVDHTWTGLTLHMLAGEGLVLPQVVYARNDVRLAKAKANSVNTMPAIALVTETIEAENYGVALFLGFFRDNTWNWTAGGLLYVDEDTAGLLTQTLPAVAGEYVQVIGVAISANIIYFNPSFELVKVS